MHSDGDLHDRFKPPRCVHLCGGDAALAGVESSSDPVIEGQMVDQVPAAAVELFEGTTNGFPSHFSAVRS